MFTVYLKDQPMCVFSDKRTCKMDWLVVFTSHRQRGHLETAPHLLSLAKDMKLGFYTVPAGDRTPGRRVAVHYTTTAPRQLPLKWEATASQNLLKYGLFLLSWVNSPLILDVSQNTKCLKLPNYILLAKYSLRIAVLIKITDFRISRYFNED